MLNSINKVKEELKSNKVMQELCEEYGETTDVLDVIPIAFKDLEVSARTEHGCIYLNSKLIDEDYKSYIIHEVTHFFQQCYNNGPTKGSTDDTYLDNKEEQEGFQNQTEFLAQEYGDNTAEKYIEKVLDHHDISGKERELKKKKLLNRKAILNKAL